MPYVPHKHGRPARGDEPTSSRTVRFTEEELEALEHHVQKTGRTRADLIRHACESAGLFRRGRIAI